MKRKWALRYQATGSVTAYGNHLPLLLNDSLCRGSHKVVLHEIVPGGLGHQSSSSPSLYLCWALGVGAAHIISLNSYLLHMRMETRRDEEIHLR